MTSSSAPPPDLVPPVGTPPPSYAAPPYSYPSAPAYGPPPGYSTPPRPRTLALLLVAAIVLAVVLVLAVLLVSGVIQLAPSSSPGPQTFAQAYAAAKANATAYPGGPWKLALAAGSAPAVGANTTVDSSLLGSLGKSCSYHLALANGSSVALAAYHGALDAGEATDWFFAFVGSGGEVLLSLDAQGSVTPIGNLECAELVLGAAFLSPVPTSDSSSAAAAAAWAGGGSAFAAANPTTSVAFAVEGSLALGSVHSGGNWSVAYSGCTASDLAEHLTAPELVVSVNATSNTVVGSTSTITECSADPGLSGIEPGAPPAPVPTIPLGTALGLGPATLVRGGSGAQYPPCADGDYCYEVPVDASAGLSLGDIGLQVNDSAGNVLVLPSGAGGASIVAVTGYTVANGPTITLGAPFRVLAWEANATLGYNSLSSIVPGMVIELDLGSSDPAGQGYLLDVTGELTFSGDVAVHLP
jgi:hypothetical protein